MTNITLKQINETSLLFTISGNNPKIIPVQSESSICSLLNDLTKFANNRTIGDNSIELKIHISGHEYILSYREWSLVFMLLNEWFREFGLSMFEEV